MFTQTKDSGKLLGNVPVSPVSAADPYVGQAAIVCVAEGVSVDCNSATAQTLYTSPAGHNRVFRATGYGFRDPSISLDTASWSVGQNSTSYNDHVANATHTGIDGVTKYAYIPAKDASVEIASGGIVKILFNTVQGAAATMKVDVFGYFTAA